MPARRLDSTQRSYAKTAVINREIGGRKKIPGSLHIQRLQPAKDFFFIFLFFLSSICITHYLLSLTDPLFYSLIIQMFEITLGNHRQGYVNKNLDRKYPTQFDREAV